MNTNYSKIALLLALGAIAGDKVGANLDVSAIKLKSLSAESALDAIKVAGENHAKINNRNKSMKEFNKAMKAYSAAFEKGLFEKTPEMIKIIESNKAARGAIVKLKAFKENLESDIKALFTENPSSSLVTKVINVSDDFKKENLIKLVSAAQGDGSFEDLLTKNKQYQEISDLLGKVEYKDEDSVKLSELITQYGVTISKFGFSGAVTKVKAPDGTSDFVDIIDVQNKIKFGLPAFAAKIASSLADLQEIGDGKVKEIVTGAKQYNAYKGIVGKLNLMPSGEGVIIDKISKKLDDWFKNFDKGTAGTAADSLNKVLLADSDDGANPGTAAEKTKAFMTFLNAVFGQNKNANASDSNVFYFSDAADGKSGSDGVVSNGESWIAGFGRLAAAADTDLDNDNTAKAAAAGAGAAGKRAKIYDNLMNPILNFINEGLGAAKKVGNRDYGINSALKSLLSATDLGDRPKYNKSVNDDKAEAYELKNHLTSVKSYVSSNKGKAAFAQEKSLIADDLSAFMSAVEQLSVDATKYLPHADAKVTHLGVFFNKTGSEVRKLVGELKDLQSQIQTELGTPAPAEQNRPEATPEQIAASKKAAAEKEAADKLAAVKTVEELEASEIFKKGGLKKIEDLSKDIKDLIKGEKDQTKAQTLFTKILKGFADKTSASIALKALFNPEIKDNLKVEADAQLDDVDMLVREAPAGALNQKQTETKPNGKLPQDRKLKLDGEIEGDEVTLQTFDLSGFLNLDTGALAEESDEELKSFNKLLADAMKSLKGKKKSVPPKTRKNKADSIIKELVARFKEDYSGDNPENAEEEEEKKAANVAKNNAVTAATKLITEKVYKAFGISTKDAPAGKGRKAPVKRGAVKGGRGRVIKRGPRNKSQQKGNKKNEKK